MKTSFTLFKLDSDRNTIADTTPGYKEAFYYFKFAFRGKRYQRCLDTADADAAQKTARTLYNAITEATIRGDLALLDKTKIRHTPTATGPAPITATVEELFTAYKAGPAEAGTKARTQNCHALTQLLKLANPGATVETLTLDKINADVAELWFNSRQKASDDADNQAKGQSFKRSANSRFRQAVSLFTPGLLDHYKRKSVYSPTFNDFVTKGRARRFKHISSGDRYNAPAPSVIEATLADWLKLEDRNVFLAAGFALSFGLRAGEISQIKWGMLTVRQNCPALVSQVDDDVQVKNQSGQLECRALDPFFSAMIQRTDKMSWRGKPDEYVLTGTTTERTGDVWRRLSDWMQDLGWKTQKQAHALRAYSGSKVFQRYSPRAAQLFLNHASVNVTEQYYSHFASKWPMTYEELEAMPERWAPAESAQPVRLVA